MILKDALPMKEYLISNICCDKRTSRRLETLSLIEGKKIKVIFIGYGGCIIQLGNARIALAREIQNSIYIEEVSDE